MSDVWLPTHTVPAAGLPTWAVPDEAMPSGNSLEGGLQVQVIAAHGRWAEVRCSNGWSAWVEAAPLLPLESGVPTARAHPPAEHLLEQLTKPGNGLLAGAVALVAGAAVSYLLWPVLAVPGLALRDVIPRGNCSSEVPGSAAMYRCSVRAGAITAAGPLATVILAMVFRRPIAAQLAKLTRRLPKGGAQLLTPVVATAMFTMMYAAVHDKTSEQTGLVPQQMFPALVGLFTFAAARVGPAVARRFGATIERRDRMPKVVRVIVALAVPISVSYVLTNQDRVTDTALKEQLVALLTLFTSYAALVPRDGDFLGAGQRFVASKTARRTPSAGSRR